VTPPEGEAITEEDAEDLEDDENEEKIRQKLPPILTYDELDRFVLAIDDLEDVLMCRLMLFAGLRVAEAAALRVKDISLEQRAVFVNMGKGNKDRWVPLDIGTLSAAHCYAVAAELKPDEPIFNYSKRTLQRHVSNIFKKAEITGDKAHCHTLRHTCATWQLDKGIPLEIVKNNLGHTDIATTQIYLHLNIRQRSRIYTDCSRFGI
jgi:integrase/recombinase XerD